MNKLEAKKLFEEAVVAGNAKMAECTPHPMTVIDRAAGKEYFVAGGVCGFAWVKIPFKAGNVKFINALKKAGLCETANDKYDSRDYKPIRKAYGGGFQYWVSTATQSMELKEAFAYGFADVLSKNGIVAYVQSRMD